MIPCRRTIAALALITVLTGCTNTAVPGPATTVTTTAAPSTPPRSPSDPLTGYEALMLCAAHPTDPSPFGERPRERTLDLDQVFEHDSGHWWVVIDERDPNPIPDDHMYPTGDSWSYCLLGGTIGKVEWIGWGGSAEDPGAEPPEYWLDGAD
jgi:hypothetical protein